ncbi:MAG: BNR repeat-containing protein [Cyclobacteriaceae bacterium]
MKRILFLFISTLITQVAYSQTATYVKTVVSNTTWATNPVIATSTQQNGIAIYENYVFMTYYNTDRKLCIARNSNYGDGSWVVVELAHTYEMRNGVWDNHNTPNIAISPNDKRIHLSFDMHARNLRYIISSENAAIASDANFVASLFSSTRDYLQSNQTAITLVTYPRFVLSDNNKLFFMYRVGGSGSGDTYFAEYKDDGFWNSPFRLIHGKTETYEGSPDRCAYFNNVHVKDGRIHLTWVWRETPDGATNHDLMFAYSDDNGATWFNSAGASLSLPIKLSSAGLNVATIPTNSGLANHNGCAVDGHGNVHVVLRVNGAYVHHYGIRDGNAYTWSNGTIDTFSGDRPKIYADQTTNDLYFLVRQNNGLRLYATNENGETWDQWSQISTLSDLFRTSTNSVMNAAGDMLTSMVVSTDNRLQQIKWSLSTNSPEIVPKTIDYVHVDPVQWTWDADGDLDGWTGKNVDQVSVQNGSIRMEWSSQASPEISVANLNADVDDFPNALIRMRVYSDIGTVNTGGGTTGTSLRIVPKSDPGDRFASFTHSTGDSEFKTYIVPLAPNTKYSGTLTSLRIQGLRNQTSTIDTLEISDFRLISDGNQWKGTISSAWEEPANWSLNKAPSGEIVTIPVVANQPIIADTLAEVADLILANGATVTVTGNSTLTVLRDLKVTGSGHVVVESGSSLLTYGDVEGSDHIIKRTTTFDSSIGQYSAVGSPVAGESTTALGDLVYRYDETVAYGSNRFVEIVSPETMSVGDAYFSAYTGDVTFEGLPNSGNVNLDLAYSSADGNNAGFNLVSNPYPSAIDFEHLVTVNDDISGTIYLWDDGGSNTGQRDNADYITVNMIGQVATANGGSGRSSDWNGAIGSAQGFFVKALGANSALHINDEMKTVRKNESANFFRKGTTESDIQSLKLSLTNSLGATNEHLLGFLENATQGYDRLYDAYKMDGANGLKVYSLLNHVPMSIQGLPLEDEMVIPLGIDVSREGEYVINLLSLRNWAGEKHIYLEDTRLNEVIDLKETRSYSFVQSQGVDDERFRIILSRNIVNAKVLNADAPFVSSLELTYDRNGLLLTSDKQAGRNVNITITDLTGAILFQYEIQNLANKAQVDFRFDVHKIYIIRVSTPDLTNVSKIRFY